MNSKQLRSLRSTDYRLRQKKQLAKNDIYIILDDVLDTYNIGAIFRLADAVAAKKIFLCGKTATPPDHKIKKSSINTTEWVEWEYVETAAAAISNLKFQMSNVQIIAIEQSVKAVPYTKFGYKLPVCLVVGHESVGVSKEVLDVCDGIVELPMYGANVSLNVMVSLGIVLYHALGSLSSKL